MKLTEYGAWYLIQVISYWPKKNAHEFVLTKVLYSENISNRDAEVLEKRMNELTDQYPSVDPENGGMIEVEAMVWQHNYFPIVDFWGLKNKKLSWMGQQ